VANEEQSVATITIHDAKTNLSKLVARVEAGEEIVIARGKTPVARLTPVRAPPATRRFGALKGVIRVGPEFFEPLSDEDLAEWE
jgi:prevent-host-death family protein